MDARDNLHLVERFTRGDANTIEYAVTRSRTLTTTRSAAALSSVTLSMSNFKPWAWACAAANRERITRPKIQTTLARIWGE